VNPATKVRSGRHSLPTRVIITTHGRRPSSSARPEPTAEKCLPQHFSHPDLNNISLTSREARPAVKVRATDE